MEEFLRRVNLVNMLTAPVGIRFQESREANILKNLLPVQRIDQIAHGLVGRTLRMFVMWQENGRWNRHAQLGSQRIIEELVVGGPPERIVNHDRAVQYRILQVRPVERNILRNPVDD